MMDDYNWDCELCMCRRELEEYKKVARDMIENPDECFCDFVYGWGNVPRSEDDLILSTFKYHGKYDFHQEGPLHSANMRKCQKCGKGYSDAPAMA